MNVIYFFKKYYHRIRLTIWALRYLPRELYVADTSYKIPSWNWQVASLCKIATTQVRGGDRLWYEPDEYEHFISLLKKGDIFFDVGANAGYYCLLAAGHGASKVVGFEIIKKHVIFANLCLRKNKINGIIVHCAVGERSTGKIAFAYSLADDRADVVSLDEATIKFGVPNVIKMDIEGYEAQALKGAKNILLSKPKLDISVHSKFLEQLSSSEEEVLSILKNAGYQIIYSFGDTYFMY